MTDASQIGWGKYNQYEGPFYRGKCSMPIIGSSAPIDQKYIAVISSTEGGRFDAINMYDRMIISAGIIQWAEAGIFGVSALLGYVMETCPEAMTSFVKYCASKHVKLMKKQVAGSNKWRFVRDDTGDVIDTVEEQKRLFLNNSNGTIGSWSNADREWAKEWAAAVATIFEYLDAQQAQIDFTSRRLMGFVMPSAQPLFNGEALNEYHSAARAAYLSFAANLPAVAAKHFQKFQQECKEAFASLAWLTHLLKELTFGPSIVIYPARYDEIRPVLERLFDINLPDFANELAKFVEEEASIDGYDNLMTVVGIQHALLVLGYDLGPTSVDGVMGPKTKKAIMDFQAKNKLVIDGIVGPRTRAVLASRLGDI